MDDPQRKGAFPQTILVCGVFPCACRALELQGRADWLDLVFLRGPLKPHCPTSLSSKFEHVPPNTGYVKLTYLVRIPLYILWLRLWNAQCACIKSAFDTAVLNVLMKIYDVLPEFPVQSTLTLMTQLNILFYWVFSATLLHPQLQKANECVRASEPVEECLARLVVVGF